MILSGMISILGGYLAYQWWQTRAAATALSQQEIDKYPPEKLLKFYLQLSPELRTKELVIRLLKRCPSTDIFALYQQIPSQILDEEIVTLAASNCAPRDLKNMQGITPLNFQHVINQVINDAMDPIIEDDSAIREHDN
jgi:hypothetical protein